MLHNIIAIDPGGETGVAWACYPQGDGKPVHEIVRKAMGLKLGGTWQRKGEPKTQALAVVEDIEECMSKVGHGKQQAYKVRTHVVCESFIPPASRARKRSILLPVQIAAYIEYHVWLNVMEVEWVWQQPNERTVVTADMLRKWELWKPGKANDDAMAALQHLIVYARKLETNG